MANLRLGLMLGYWMTGPEDPIALVREAEDLGFDSVWTAEAYGSDCVSTLSWVGARTTRIKLGTGIVLVPERHPLLLAKEVSTLDLFSGGRFLFGIGAGWLREETELMGGDFDHRWGQTRESILAMKELWTKPEAEYHGKYYDFPPVRSNPKPAQKPHPPVLLGGDAPRVLERIVAWGDGWLPNRVTPEQLRERRATLDRLAREAGRDPAAISISVHGQPADRDLIRRFHDAGATRVIVRPATTRSESEMVTELTRIADALIG